MSNYTEPTKKYKYDDPISLWILEEYEKQLVSNRHEVTLPVPLSWIVTVIKADRRRHAAELKVYMEHQWADSEANGNWPPMKQIVLTKLAQEADIQ